MSEKANLNDLTDAEFIRQFEECKIDPTAFDHEAHLRLAWVHIRKFGLEQAKENIERQLKKFVAEAGASDKYHQTLTIAAIEAVNHFMDKSSSDNFQDFISEFPQLKTNFKDLIDSHYSFDILHSEKAKTTFVEPDVQPF